MLTLSPMTVATVCHVGDPLLISCTASVRFIRWNVFQLNEQGMLEDIAVSVQINSLDANQMAQRGVNSSTFTFTRISAREASPLITTLSIDSVSIRLNGTVVGCSDVANPMTSASTIIQLFDTTTISELAKNIIILLLSVFY